MRSIPVHHVPQVILADYFKPRAFFVGRCICVLSDCEQVEVSFGPWAVCQIIERGRIGSSTQKCVVVEDVNCSHPVGIEISRDLLDLTIHLLVGEQ